MKRLCSAFAIATYAAFFFVACGSSSSTGSNDSPKISDADIEVESYKGLPSCTEKREGETAYVVDQEQGYVCENGKWIEDDAAVEIKSSSSSSGSNVSIDIHAEENNSASYVPEKNVPIKNKTITGFAQKGPFKAGSVVDIFELELDGKTFAQTGKSFTGKVSNDSGAFKISNVSLKSQYALLRVTGSFKSEINGESFHGTLTAVTDLSKRENVNVNILTHLEYDRVLYLLGKGMNFTSAKKQAEREVLAAFGIEGKLKNTEDMNVLGDSESDAALIAVSKMLLAGKGEETNRDEENLTEILAEIAIDLEEDGEWENIGGRNNSPGDYCPWDNKWQIAARSSRFIKYLGENEFGCDMDDVTCKIIRHFVMSWDVVGRYCTSAINDEIFCNWNSDYRDYGVTCEDFSQCKEGEWFKVSLLKADTYKWSKGKDGEIKKGDKSGQKYKYDSELGEWCKAYSLDILLNACTMKKNGEIIKESNEGDSYRYYLCENTVWSEISVVYADTYKWMNGTDGEIKKGDRTDSYYIYDAENESWRTATEYEVDTYKWTSATDGTVKKSEKTGFVYKYDQMLSGWFIVSEMDLVLGICTKKHDGEIKKEKNEFYTCADGNWRKSDISEITRNATLDELPKNMSLGKIFGNETFLATGAKLGLFSLWIPDIAWIVVRSEFKDGVLEIGRPNGVMSEYNVSEAELMRTFFEKGGKIRFAVIGETLQYSVNGNTYADVKTANENTSPEWISDGSKLQGVHLSCKGDNKAQNYSFYKGRYVVEETTDGKSDWSAGYYDIHRGYLLMTPVFLPSPGYALIIANVSNGYDLVMLSSGLELKCDKIALVSEEISRNRMVGEWTSNKDEIVWTMKLESSGDYTLEAKNGSETIDYRGGKWDVYGDVLLLKVTAVLNYSGGAVATAIKGQVADMSAKGFTYNHGDDGAPVIPKEWIAAQSE